MSKGLKRNQEEVPQWVRDFIVQRQRELLEGTHLKWLGTEADESDDTYLLCPLSDNQVEALRAGAYRLREKTIAQERKKPRLRKREIEKRELKERRRLRGRGEFVPDSGISCVDDFKEFNKFLEAYNDPLLSTQFVRRDFCCSVDSRRMQQSLVRYFRWEKWSEDPWGSFPKFCEWLTSARDNEMAVWAVNETAKGRDYLVRGTLEGLSQLDYSKMTEKDLLTQIGYGAASFLDVKRYTGWEDFLNNYPTEPLPVGLVNERVSKVYPFDFKLPYSRINFPLPQKADGSLDIPKQVPRDPFEEIEDFLSLFIDARNYGPLTRYRFLVSSIYLWYIALDGARERAKGHPELEGFLDYHAATDARIADLCRKLAPKGYHSPDENQAFMKLYQALKKPLDAEERRYANVLENGGTSTLGSLLEGVTYWKSKAAQATIAGLKGQLGNSLLSIVKHDFIDAAREKRTRKKHEVTESEIEATRVTDNDTPFLDTIRSPELTPEELMLLKEPIDLKSLGLNIADLTPREYSVFKDWCQALREDIPLTEYWHKKDYDKNIKALKRAKAKLKKR